MSNFTPAWIKKGFFNESLCPWRKADPDQQAEEAAAVQHLYPRSPHAAQDRIFLCSGVGPHP
jgi:hypothetical protein